MSLCSPTKEHRIDAIDPAAAVRVAAVPAAHPYVRAVTADRGIAVLADPVPDPAHPERWWPPAMLDAAWIRRAAADFDVMHVHFGMESLPEGRLAGALDALDELGKPLVYTVHDLQNPQLVDQAAHRADLAALIPRATALVTLTDAAAAQLRRDWGRDAVVLAHPTLLADDARAPAEAGARAPVIGVHLRDLRPSIDAPAALRALRSALDALALAGEPATGRVLLHTSTRDASLALQIEAELRVRDDCEVIVRDRPDDAALLAEIDALDVALLPYGHGTHSGWVELCFDRGVPVAGPRGLPMATQHPEAYAGLADADDAGRAVLDALAAGTRAGSAARRRLVVDRAPLRRAERGAVARAHATLYRELVAGVAGAAAAGRRQ